MTLTTQATAVRATAELWRLGALELAAGIRQRAFSSREVLEAHLDRIAAVNPALNAITVLVADAAIEAAGEADRAVAAGDTLGPLHGVPFTVKENLDLVGTATTIGLRALAGAYPSRDAPSVERLRAAGAIPIGHTNCPSLAVRWHTDSELYGATANPWDASLTPGASSGGEAVALATGMSPLGVGNDGLGSLRWPAQCCGVAALKPTLGRIPDASSTGPGDLAIGVQLTSVNGPMARHVVDLRAALEVMAGIDPRDPWSVPAPLRGPDLPRPVRVALVLDPGGLGADPQVVEGLRIAARTLEDAGYVVEELEPPGVEEACRTLLDMLNTPDVRALWTTTAPMLPDDTRRFLTDFQSVAGEVSAVGGFRSLVGRSSLLRAWSAFQEEHPLILAPIGSHRPFPAGRDLDEGAVAESVQRMRMAMAVNALGLPAVAVPVGIGEGLPQVVQIIGPRYREDACLDAAEALEERLGTLTPIEPRARERGVQ
jgi:amidase